MSGHQVVEADLTWTGAGFESGIQVEVDLVGRIARVGRLGLVPTLRLPRQALLPGFVNAHSHAFQRGLRGRGERFPEGKGSFWTWREAMYQLVEELDPEGFHRLTLQCFREMRLAGITTVGEFHYFRHVEGHDFGFDRLVPEAAAEAGIRLALLPTYYKTGGIGQPLGPGQRRFATQTPREYWTSFDALAAGAPGNVTFGAVVHSVRASPLPDLAEIHAESVRRGLVFHIHVEEQRKEIEECLAAYGTTPMRALLDRVGATANVTAIHCTHTGEADRAEFLDRGGRMCLCPTTEGNLGDGIPVLDGVPLDRLCLGTDSNARLDVAEDCRWLEYGQRLRTETRGAFRGEAGDPAASVFRAATVNGAAALGLDAGRMTPGAWADFQTLALRHPSLAGAEPETLLAAWLFGAGADVIAATCVGGRWAEHRPAP